MLIALVDFICKYTVIFPFNRGYNEGYLNNLILTVTVSINYLNIITKLPATVVENKTAWNFASARED